MRLTFTAQSLGRLPKTLVAWVQSARHSSSKPGARLLGHDFFMAVIEGRLDKDSQEFFNSWFGALFNEDGTLCLDEERYDDEGEETAFDFWTDMRDTCSRFEYDKNCHIG